MRVIKGEIPDCDDIYHGHNCFSWLDPNSHFPACMNPACYYIPQRHRCFSQANMGQLDNYDRVMKELTYYFQFLNDQLNAPIDDGISEKALSPSADSPGGNIDSVESCCSTNYDLLCPCLTASHNQDVESDCTIATATISFFDPSDAFLVYGKTGEGETHHFARMNPL